MIASPPLAYPCFYGIDIQTRQELIAANHSVAEINEIIGSDTLHFLSIAGLKAGIGLGDQICTSYFDGIFPTPLYDYEHDYNLGLKEKVSFY